MPGKIFVSYRRDDARDMAARIRDRLAATFGDANVFMDVDNLMAGQRFDKELEKALGETDALLAVIGPRWLELLAKRRERGDEDERDYVCEEIAAALERGIVVIPVLIETTSLPKASALPEGIRDLVRHQKHVVTHEQFGRDVAGLVGAIRFARKSARAGARGWTSRWIAASALAALLLVGGVWWITASGPSEAERQSALLMAEVERKRTEETERQRLAALKAEEERKRAEEAERQRLASLKAEEERERVEDAKKRSEPDLMRPGREFRDCPDVCPLMVVLPAGEFMMGSPPGEAGRSDDEGPQRKVTIARPFAVGKYEIMFAEWDTCAAERGCTSNPRPANDGGRGRRPVVDVSWHDAKEYAAWLSRKTGKTYRLLSEAEWEYAARAGTTTPYAFGQTISRNQAHYWGTKSVEVGRFPPNKFGLHDLHGNAWEWCEDNWHAGYKDAPQDGSVWQGGDASQRVLRGGSRVAQHPEGVRSALRRPARPDMRTLGEGFRVARTL